MLAKQPGGYTSPLDMPWAPARRRGVEQPLHVRQLARGDGALGEAHDGEPQGAVADERRDVDRVAARGARGQVLAERAPVPGHAVQAPGVVRPVLDASSR